jgi:leader peptidase (prepilin peptidase)/N-methyltransferase
MLRAIVDDQTTDDFEPLLGRMEIAGAAVFAVAATLAALVMLPLPAALATGVLALLMALITLTDLRHFIIPDVLSLPAVPLGVLANIAVFHADDWAAGLGESVIGAVLAAGTFYLLRAGYFRLRGAEGLGLGDVKLAAVAGAWLGPPLLAPACFVAALGGLVAVLVMAILPGRKISATDHIPFGSFIAPAILLFWVWRVIESAGL